MTTRTMLFGLLVGMAATFVIAGCNDSGNKFSADSAKYEQAASSRSQLAGQMAPDFTIKDQNAQDVTLSKLRGQWVVLYFYPKDDTPACACEATDFTALLASFHGMNAKIYGISPDPAAAHRAFIEGYKLSIDLLSDPDHKVMKEYGAWMDASIGEKSYGRVVRSTVIIDPTGKICYHWPEVIPTGHAERVRQKLAQLQAGPKQVP